MQHFVSQFIEKKTKQKQIILLRGNGNRYLIMDFAFSDFLAYDWFSSRLKVKFLNNFF